MTRIDQVASDVYRISTFNPQFMISMNQFLIVDDRPALIHTGTHPSYDVVRKAVAELIDPKKLAYVCVPHFEADECGGMGRFVAEAPKSTLVCSAVGHAINLCAWDYCGPVQGVSDGETIPLGRHTLRFIETPHVHHWDSMMVYEDSTASLFPADLFIQPGEQPAIVKENLSRDMLGLYREAGIFASETPVRQTVDRIERMKPKWIHPMHGGSLASDVAGGYVKALREEPFAYQGKLFGRMLPS